MQPTARPRVKICIASLDETWTAIRQRPSAVGLVSAMHGGPGVIEHSIADIARQSTSTMGKNNRLRKAIIGQLRAIQRHHPKIDAELRKSSPDAGYVRKWQKEIDVARARMAKLEERLVK